MNSLFTEAREKKIFKNEEILFPDYLPEFLPGREREVKEIAFLLQPVVEVRKPLNIVLLGPPGTGKTCCTKFVLKQLSDYSAQALPIYVNCWEHDTRQSILVALSDAFKEILPRRGVASEELLQRTVEAVKRENKIPVIVLDEIDRLSIKNEQQVLYSLSRASENWGVKIALITITNDPAFLSKLDSRIKSSLAGASIKFTSYSPQELKQILSERAKQAFLPGACSIEAIALCAAHAAKNGGDARIGIQMLLLAARNAEARNASRVEVADARKALENTELNWERIARKEELQLSECEEKIMDFLRERKSTTSRQLYNALSEKGESERTIRGYLALLEKRNLIKTSEVSLEKGRGRRRIIVLNE